MTAKQIASRPYARQAVGVFFTVALLAVMVRPLPVFPDLMSEGSLFAINRAAANHLQFGRDIIISHGPYASVYTSRYHPGLEHLRLAGQILIALACSASLLKLFRGRQRWWLLAFLYVMTVVEKPLFCDAVFYFVPWLFVMLAYRYASDRDAASDWRDWALFGLLAVCLAMIALVKSSYSLAAFFLLALGVSLIWTRDRKLAVGVGSLGVVALWSFWILAGQSAFTLPHAFIAQRSIISGYSDAVSASGRSIEIVGYVVLCVCAIVLLARHLFRTDTTITRRFVLLVALLATLFLAGKGAYVRHTAHGMIAADAIALVSFTLIPILPRWNIVPLFSIALVFWADVNSHYSHQAAPYLPHPRLNPLTRAYWSDLVNPAIEGIRCQFVPARLQAHYRRALERMATEIPLPSVRGRTDIQDSRYDLLEAHGIEISQRPVPESYSTWTPELAKLNAAYFESEDRPTNVFFRVTAIDQRLPSLEDSLCWPLWLGLYEIRPEKCPPYMLLTKRSETARIPHFTPAIEQSARMQEQVALPQGSGVLWAEIDVPSTLLGSATSLFFKRPGLQLTYHFADGRAETFRYVDGLGRSGFFLSPIVRDNADFTALHNRQLEHFSGRLPVAFSISPTAGGRQFWGENYRVRIATPDG